MSAVIEKLRAEHRNMERLLAALERQIAVLAAGGRPDYDVIGCVADYFLDYPDRCHHPKEDAVVERLQQAAAAESASLAVLPAEHRTLHESAQQFRRRLTALLGETDIAGSAVVEAAVRFVAAQRRHMQLEETQFFPMAERLLSEADWRGVEATLLARADPLFGPEVERHYRYLSERLLAWDREAPASAGSIPLGASGLT